ncbi:hypothetical protein BV898_15590 [Hypsibius exemplaris]|uniref:Glycosyl hydrolase family 63 C-terminal domain-containing protein n=1 Tax=Hypsibius exemplaris TaxID=2072580 RepID=A0A9X6NBD4_HYPEX|nr:hypothetical protein BV898_15590 [Hypsibius exemplaris]
MSTAAQSDRTAEGRRLVEDKERKDNWKRWGPYLSDRQWGTVREDYSADGNCWDYFTHDQARSRAYRWGEDGLLGICDRECRLCFSFALWNGKDPILKERLYGLTGSQGNHGEDVKELYYHLDATPTTSYAKALYKYPQAEYPYEQINVENRNRGKDALEFEVEDSGVFDENKYWDVVFEYAKNTSQDILCRLSVHNRGPEPATIHVLPTLWFRNTWIWGCKHEGCTAKPRITLDPGNPLRVKTKHDTLEEFVCEWEALEGADAATQLLFTENETNSKRLYGVENYTPYVKDAFHRFVVGGDKDAVSSKGHGTKVAAHHVLTVPAGQSKVIRVRFHSAAEQPAGGSAFADFDAIFEQRKKEADEFYREVQPSKLDDQRRLIQRQAYAGMLWSKQFYHYIVGDWLLGDPEMPKPPDSRLHGRNNQWGQLYNRDIVSMPDKWEYPWYASWDLAFHMLPLSNVDFEFAKAQLMLFLREWYMHPNGQIPAYEFALGDVNPPVHAWAVIRLFESFAGKDASDEDYRFLESCFHKLIINFTWWVNRKDPEGNNLYSGGFLGLDNIGVFDRSKPLPPGMILEQADGTAWMAFFCATMLHCAINLALKDPVYEDMASKFFEHTVLIIDAINNFGKGQGLWNEEDGFYYDHLRKDGRSCPMKIRSLVGLVPLFSVLVIDDSTLKKLPAFAKRTKWFVQHRKDLIEETSFMAERMGEDANQRSLLCIPSKAKLIRVLEYLFDENEFLSEFGIRSLSKFHEKNPFKININNEELRADYIPGESNSYLFGGNSNWRGPIWFPMNFLLVQSLQRFDYYYGESLKIEVPTRSGNFMRLRDAADELCNRLLKNFLPDSKGFRACHGKDLRLSEKYATDPHFKDLVLFYEFFHGDNGRGCGASHQTGWTGLIINCINILAGTGHLGVFRPGSQ